METNSTHGNASPENLILPDLEDKIDLSALKDFPDLDMVFIPALEDEWDDDDLWVGLVELIRKEA